MTETRFYEPARLSTPPKPLLLLTPLDAQAGWGHCYLRSSVWETGSSQYCLELHHGTVWGWIFRTTFWQLSAQRRELKQWWQRRQRKHKIVSSIWLKEGRIYTPNGFFSCSRVNYTWGGQNSCAISLLEFVTKRPTFLFPCNNLPVSC